MRKQKTRENSKQIDEKEIKRINMNWEKLEHNLNRKVNIHATNKRIKRIFELYHLYKGIIALENGKTIKKIENGKVFLGNVNSEYQEYIDMIDNTLNSLEEWNEEEYQVFYDFYVEKKSGVACSVDLCLSEAQFYRIKSKAVEKVARLLECVIYE